MAQGIDAITTTALKLALDAASMKQRAIAANIANHAVEGYVPVKLDFESQMAAARDLVAGGGRLDGSTLSSVRLELQPALDEKGAPAKVHLDEQVAQMAQNTAHFQVLARALSKHLATMHSAVSDGKR